MVTVESISIDSARLAALMTTLEADDFAAIGLPAAGASVKEEEDLENKILLTSSWICGIGYTILFGGSMTF